MKAVKGVKLSEYGFVRVGVVTPEMKIADIDFNTKSIIKAIETAKDRGCRLLAFPELCITGYSCGDLFFQEELVSGAIRSIYRIKEVTNRTKSTVIVGAPILSRGKLFNCGVFISCGKILGIVPKTYLCNSGEYYEERWFSSSKERVSDEVEMENERIAFGEDLIFTCINIRELKVGIEICEDLWAILAPSFEYSIVGATVLFNISASNEYLGKTEYRSELIKTQSARCIAAYCYSAAGPNESTTDLIYSGNSMIAENGRILNETKKYEFTTQIAIADIDIERLIGERERNSSYGFSKKGINTRNIEFELFESEVAGVERKIESMPFVPFDLMKRKEVCSEIFLLQATGLAKRIKHLNISKLVIGVSGGLDSTLALLVAVKTFYKLGLNRKGISAISMPGMGTTERTKSSSKSLASKLGVTYRLIPINEAVRVHLKDIKHVRDDYNITFENAQARERTQILMDLANENNAIVLGTSDLSEIALGWSTYGGDHISMYNVNAGVPKTLVKYIVEWCAEEEFKGDVSRVLKDIIATPISPELLPPDSNGKIKQKTEELIGPFELHDFYLYYFVRFGFSPKKIIFLAELAFGGKYSKRIIKKWLNVFINRFFNNQFKRSCMPDGIKVGTVALSPRGDWRMPSDAESNLWMLE